MKPQPQISPGFASDEDADLADELLIGFEEGVPWNYMIAERIWVEHCPFCNTSILFLPEC